jgi:hypothetical protein
MRRKREIIEELLKSLSIMEEFYEPPEVILKQFTNWLNSVSAILYGANMRDEINIWNEALQGIRFSDDLSLSVVMSTAKATLLGLLNKLESTAVFNTPYLNHEDVMNGYKMSELYVILHCYENSVRRFIEQIFYKEFGDNWWEQVATEKDKGLVDGRKQTEAKNKWISPRGGNSPLYYVEWGDLVKLIRKHEQLFRPYIGSLRFVENRFADLENLRNIVAHNGVLPSEDDFQRVIISFRDWCRQIGYS